MGVRARLSVLVVAAGTVGLVGLTSVGHAAGPIKDDSNTEMALDIPVSHQLWDGMITVENTGDEVLILDDVSLVGRTPTLRFLGAYTHRKPTPTSITTAAGRSWPPRGARPYRPLAGTRVLPADRLERGMEQTQVLIRLRAPATPGTVGFDAVRIRYHVGDERFVVWIRHALTVCARPKGEPVKCGSRARSAGRPPAKAHWLGESFEGLPVTYRFGTSVIYGDCDASEGGCAPPMEIQAHSICTRHPLEIDLVPRSIKRVRGVPVIGYSERFEVLTGSTNAVVFANDGAQARRAVDVVRPDGTAQVRPRLASPQLPRWVLRQLRLVRERARGVDDLRDLREELGISRSAIRMRLRLAAVLGAGALAGVRPASMTPGEIIEDRQAYLGRQEGFDLDAEEERRARRHARRIRAC